MKTLIRKRAVLVYQAGIANVFAVESFNLSDYGRDATRLLQSDFSTCAAFARGMKAAGTQVKVCGCNMAGDVTRAHWTDNLDELPFSDKFTKVDEINNLA